MNALEQTQKVESDLIKTINESGLPLTTIHYMLSNIQRQIADVLNANTVNTVERTESDNAENCTPEG